MSNMVQAMSESAAATGVSAGSAEFPPPTTRAGEEGNKHRRQQQKYKVRAIPFLYKQHAVSLPFAQWRALLREREREAPAARIR